MNTRRTCTIVLALASLLLAQTAFAQEAASATDAGAFRQEGIASWYGAEFEGRPTASGEAFVSSALTAAHPTLPFGTMVKVTNRHNGKSVMVRINDRGPFVAARIIDVSRGAAELLDMIITGTAPVIVESSVPIPGVVAEPPVPQVPADTEAEQPDNGTPFITATIEKDGSIEVSGEAVEIIKEGADRVAPSAVPVAAPIAPPPAPPPQAAAPAASPAVQPLTLPPARVIPQMPNPADGKNYRIQVGSYKVERFAALAFDKLDKAGLKPAYERYQDMYRVVIPMVPSTQISWYAAQLGNLGFREILVRQER